MRRVGWVVVFLFGWVAVAVAGPSLREICLHEPATAAAAAACDAALLVTPDDGDLLLARGRARWRLGRHDEGDADFRAVLALPGETVRDRLRRAEVYFELDVFDAILPELDDAVTDAPESIEARLARGEARLAFATEESALEDFAFVLDRDPGSRAARLGRARISLVRGRLEEAAADLRDLADRPGAEVDELALSVAVETRLGHLDVARARLDAAIAAHPEAPHLLETRARDRLTVGDVDGALVDAEAMVAGMPRSARPFVLRSEIRLATGDVDGAIGDLEAAHGREPNAVLLRRIDEIRRRAHRERTGGTTAGARAHGRVRRRGDGRRRRVGRAT